MKLRATRLSSVGNGARIKDPYGRMFLADAASGLLMPPLSTNYTRSGPDLWCPQIDGAYKNFPANVIPREWANGRWGFRFDPSFTQLWPDPRDMSLRSKVGFNNVVPSALGPDRLTQSWSLTEDTSAGAHNLSTNPAYTASVAHTVSVVAKERAGSAKRYLLLVQTSTGFGTNLFACFDLANGASVASAGVIANTEPLADGYWRCNMVSTPTSTVTSNTQVRLSNTFAAATANYTGDGASGLDVWLTNVTNAGYSVPLAAGAATIGAANCTALLSTLGTQLGSEYTVAVDYTTLTTAADKVVMGLSSGAFANSIYVIPRNGSGNQSFSMLSGNVPQLESMSTNAAGVGERQRAVLRAKADDSRAAVNGILAPRDAACVLPVGLTNIRLAGAPWGGPANDFAGHVHKLWLTPSRALTDTELQAVTA